MMEEKSLMGKSAKHIFLFLKERNGEYEYLHRSVHEIPDGKQSTANKVAKNYAKEFYGGKPEKEDGGYYFHGGEVFVKVYSWQFISEEKFNALREFL